MAGRCSHRAQQGADLSLSSCRRHASVKLFKDTTESSSTTGDPCRPSPPLVTVFGRRWQWFQGRNVYIYTTPVLNRWDFSAREGETAVCVTPEFRAAWTLEQSIQSGGRRWPTDCERDATGTNVQLCLCIARACAVCRTRRHLKIWDHKLVLYE